MSWTVVVLGIAGLASMKAAFEAGDLDETARQGQLAGAAVVERALGAPDRLTRLAGITAAPGAGAPELLVALAELARSPDRRVAVPAALAARELAHRLRADADRGELSDELARADVVPWRDAWALVALDRERWIELRVPALDTTAALERVVVAAGAREPGPGPAKGVAAGIGISLATALADPDPAFRLAALAVAPLPLPVRLRAPIAAAIADDADPHVVLGAAQALCTDLVVDPPAPILAALGTRGLARLQQLIATPDVPTATLRDAARCLSADKSPASAAALRGMRARLR